MTGLIPNPHFEEEQKKLLELNQRAARGNVEAALSVLAKAPERPPLPSDEIIADN